jgi:KDO2-lipid IV(A) lauroyltransferase
MANKDLMKKFRHMLLYGSIRGMRRFLNVLPRKIAISYMRVIGLAAFYVLISRRRRTIQNLSLAFGEEKSPAEIQEIARQVFLNFSTFAADAIRIPLLIENGLDSLVAVRGLENLDELSGNHRGAILLTAHFGNWELLGAWLAWRGYRIKAVGAPNGNQKLNRMIAEARNRAGYQSIERGAATREILRALASGYSIGVLIDLDTKVEGVCVNFFNQWAHTPVGPVKLARKYDLKIIPMFIRLTDNYTYVVEVNEPLPLVFTGEKGQDLIFNTQMCSDACEEIIRRYPEQWLWIMRRWKKQPDGAPRESSH